jgi:hypothetical protein
VLSKFAKFARYQLTSHVAIARNWKEPLSRQLIYEENGQIKAHFLTEYPADPKKNIFMTGLLEDAIHVSPVRNTLEAIH